MKTFVPHLEGLLEDQKSLWHELSPCKELGFVLYGGTAIALQLGHRFSIDFDFFSHLPLDEAKENELLESLPFLKESSAIQVAPNTRSYLTQNDVKLSFMGGIHLGRIGEPRNTDDGILQVASLDDLMAMKLATVMQRVEIKDYRDIAAMIQNGMSLEKGLSGAIALYGKQFAPSESLRTLAYFQGGNLQSLSTTDKNTLLQATRNFSSFSLDKLPHAKRLSEELTHMSQQPRK